MDRKMHFGDFNPLDVLATAASLQSARLSNLSTEAGTQAEESDKDDSEGGATEDANDANTMARDTDRPTTTTDRDNTVSVVGDAMVTVVAEKNKENELELLNSDLKCRTSTVGVKDNGVGKDLSQPCVVQVVPGSVGKLSDNSRPVVSLKDTASVILPNKTANAKMLAVLKINRLKSPDHSYASLCSQNKLKVDEDEGYSSRSSLDSPGMCCRSDYEQDVFDREACGPLSPVPPSPQTRLTNEGKSPCKTQPDTPTVSRTNEGKSPCKTQTDNPTGSPTNEGKSPCKTQTDNPTGSAIISDRKVHELDRVVPVVPIIPAEGECTCPTSDKKSRLAGIDVQTALHAGKKHAKIVIVSKDSNGLGSDGQGGESHIILSSPSGQGKDNQTLKALLEHHRDSLGRMNKAHLQSSAQNTAKINELTGSDSIKIVELADKSQSGIKITGLGDKSEIDQVAKMPVVNVNSTLAAASSAAKSTNILVSSAKSPVSSPGVSLTVSNKTVQEPEASQVAGKCNASVIRQQLNAPCRLASTDTSGSGRHCLVEVTSNANGFNCRTAKSVSSDEVRTTVNVENDDDIPCVEVRIHELPPSTPEPNLKRPGFKTNVHCEKTILSLTDTRQSPDVTETFNMENTCEQSEELKTESDHRTENETSVGPHPVATLDDTDACLGSETILNNSGVEVCVNSSKTGAGNNPSKFIKEGDVKTVDDVLTEPAVGGASAVPRKDCKTPVTNILTTDKNLLTRGIKLVSGTSLQGIRASINGTLAPATLKQVGKSASKPGLDIATGSSNLVKNSCSIDKVAVIPTLLSSHSSSPQLVLSTCTAAQSRRGPPRIPIACTLEKVVQPPSSSVAVTSSAPPSSQATVTLLIASAGPQQVKFLPQPSRKGYVIEDDIPPTAKFTKATQKRRAVMSGIATANKYACSTEERAKVILDKNSKTMYSRSAIVGSLRSVKPIGRTQMVSAATYASTTGATQLKLVPSLGSKVAYGRQISLASGINMVSPLSLSTSKFQRKELVSDSKSAKHILNCVVTQPGGILHSRETGILGVGSSKIAVSPSSLPSVESDFQLMNESYNKEDSEKSSDTSPDTPTSSTSRREAGGVENICATPLRPSTPASGRMTPVQALENSASDKINIKISGSKVLDISGAERPGTPTRKAFTNIGMLGSLSRKPLSVSAPVLPPVKDIGTGSVEATVGSFSVAPSMIEPDTNSTQFSTTLNNRERKSWSTSSSGSYTSVGRGRPGRKPKVNLSRLSLGRNIKVTYPMPESNDHLSDTGVSARTCHSYIRRKRKLELSTEDDGNESSNGVELVSRLHPLIDHDYCKFAEFSGEIQSSIIATTETKLRNERKYARKTKAARTKAVRTLAVTNDTNRVKRKYVRRKPTKSQLLAAAAQTDPLPESDLEDDSSPEVAEKPLLCLSESKEEFKRQTSMEKKIAKNKSSPMKKKNSANYVKITGSYQDDFVYFATKKSERRGRPVKNESVVDSNKHAAVGGINVFDWYRDLSKADKGFRFGVSGMGVQNKKSESETVRAKQTVPNTTPLHESEVVDLVMDMMPDGDYGSLIPPGQSPLKSDSENLASASGVTKPTGGDVNQAELNAMLEQVRTMLDNMGEAELKSTIEILGDAASHEEVVGTTSSTSTVASTSSCVGTSKDTIVSVGTTGESTMGNLNGLLGPYNQECGQSLSQGSHMLGDLDEINDSDLLPSDLGNMNMILGDFDSHLKVPVSGSSVLKDMKAERFGGLDTGSPVKQPVSGLNMLLSDCDQSSSDKPFTETDQEMVIAKIESDLSNHAEVDEISNYSKPPDRTELFPDVTERPNLASDFSAPELTVVSMYWNDLPGLIINGKQYVRLVDIHKQILPAKDTGILKKRCQMMGLEIINCSELQRDFLIRYANATKSKSTVIVPKQAAKTLIGFYVDPRRRVSRPREEKNADSQDDTIVDVQDSADADDTGSLRFGCDSPSCPGTESSVGQVSDVNEGTSTVASSNSSRAPSPPDFPPPSETHKTYQKKSVESRPGHKKSKSTIAVAKALLPQKPPPLLSQKPPPPGKGSGSNIKRGSSVVVAEPDRKRSERLRHKKSQSYVAMLQGNYAEVEKEESNRGRTHSRSPKESHNDEKETEKGDDSNTENQELNAKGGVCLSFPEEQEIRRLRNKQKRKRLTKKEKRRLKRLREKLRRNRIGFQKRKDDKLTASSKKRDKRALVRAKLKLREKNLNGRKFGSEHCYAAYHYLARNKNVVRSPLKNKLDKRTALEMDQLPPVKLKLAVNGRDKCPVPPVACSSGNNRPIISKIKKQDIVSARLFSECSAVENKNPNGVTDLNVNRQCKNVDLPLSISDSKDNHTLSTSTQDKQCLCLNQATTRVITREDINSSTLDNLSSTQVGSEQTVTSVVVAQKLTESSSARSDADTSHGTAHDQEDNTLKQVVPESKLCSMTIQNVPGSRSSSRCTTPTAFRSKSTRAPSEGDDTTSTTTVLKVVRRQSAISGGDQRGKVQEGLLHLDLYKSRDSACLQCCTCEKYLNLREFNVHIHQGSSRLDTVESTLPQKLELDSLHPSSQEWKLWEEFERKRVKFSMDYSGGNSVVSVEGSTGDVLPKENKSNVFLKTLSVNRSKISQRKRKIVEPKPAVLTPLETVSEMRHSSRTRKKKQLHPMEKYVYSELTPSTGPKEKRAKLSEHPQKTPHRKSASNEVAKQTEQLSDAKVMSSSDSVNIIGDITNASRSNVVADRLKTN